MRIKEKTFPYKRMPTNKKKIFPGPGLEPMSPALAGGFLTTAPPGKPSCGFHKD